MANPSDEPERQRGYQRAYRTSAKGRGTRARYRIANRDAQRRYETAREGPHRGLRRYHNMTPEDWAATFDAQQGKCYLCGRDLDPGARNGDNSRPCVDHIHEHCGPEKSCAACRRGIACRACNIIVGFAGDDPALLHAIAEALAVANEAARIRIAAAPVQGELFGG